MTRQRSEAGFTLIELLVVLVIMPLIIGAIAAAIIISEQDSGVASSRLSDSASAQTISEFYVRDVQGAQYVTTDSTASSPAVCVDSSVSSPTLVLGLYRPATPSSNSLSVGYWVTASGSNNLQLVRYTCNSSGAMTSQVVITSDLTSASQVTATIAPTTPFGKDAESGWTPTTTTSPPASISTVTISLMEPGSDYAYNLPASPRVWASDVSGDGGPGSQSGAALVSLGSVTVSNTASITVNGNVEINGALTGSGITAPGYSIKPSAGVTDPLAPYLPSPVTVPTNTVTGSACNISSGTVMLAAGTYNCPLVVQSGATATLGPGVYQLNGGITVSGTLNYTNAPSAQGEGVLLYVPCSGSCSAVTFAAGASVTLPPFNAGQSLAASSSATTNPNTTALQNMWLWQAATDSTQANLIGNGQGTSTGGIAYAPAATVDLSNARLSDATGEIVAGGINASGTASLTITGQ